MLGHGTAAMTHLPAGTELDVLTGLGNGYDTSLAGERPLLVGGGVGIPPLYGLARRLTAEHRQVTAGCTCRTKYGHKRICKDGPVLRREEIVW